jgi:manganese-dependent inorganic pyrophosphatase
LGKIFKFDIIISIMIYVIGHLSPDSDSVCSAIAVSDLKKQLGIECEPRVAGKINDESSFILEKFGFKAPEILSSAKDEDIILVDHSDLSQGIEGLDEARVVGIIDHHKLGDVETSVPVEVLIRPLGCTCTIVKGLFDYYEKEISKEIAGIMLCAILSDTVIFKSPTTTDEDRKVVDELAKIAGVENIEELGMEMFRVKSDVDGVSAKDLVMRDYKDFDMGGKKIGVGQLELVDLGMLDGIVAPKGVPPAQVASADANRVGKDELLEEMGKLMDDGRDAVFLMLTDIMREGTMLLYVSKDVGLREEVFGESEEGWHEGMMSRKKQIVPKLEEYFR